MKMAWSHLHSEMGKRRLSVATTRRWDCILKGVDWMVGGVVVFSLVAIALAVFANRALVGGNIAHALLEVFLGDWLLVLASIGLGVILTWLLIRAKTVCRIRVP